MSSKFEYLVGLCVVVQLYVCFGAKCIVNAESFGFDIGVFLLMCWLLSHHFLICFFLENWVSLNVYSSSLLNFTPLV